MLKPCVQGPERPIQLLNKPVGVKLFEWRPPQLMLSLSRGKLDVDTNGKMITCRNTHRKYLKAYKGINPVNESQIKHIKITFNVG